MTQDELMECIEKFRKRHSLTKSAFGLMTSNSSGFLASVELGRKLRGKTISNIIKRMELYEADKRKADKNTLDNIAICGFVTVEHDGIPRLESNAEIDPASFRRLIEDGLLIASGDAMFGCQSQTYRPAQ